MSTSVHYDFDTKVLPDTILDALPEIKRAAVLFEPEGSTELVRSPFAGFVNVFKDSGDIIPIKTVKSSRYSELSHKFTFETVVRELEKLSEGIYVHHTAHNGDYSIVETSLILDKPFSLNETPFEFNLPLPPTYSGSVKEEDVFYPMIRVKNSFQGCSEVTFDLYRSICSNGLLIGKVMSKEIRFRHFGDVISRFNQRTEEFLMEIFEKKFINNIFEEYQGRSMSKKELQEFTTQYLGKRISKEIEEGEIFILPKKMSAWVALQVISYYTTHKIKNQDRAVQALSAFANLK